MSKRFTSTTFGSIFLLISVVVILWGLVQFLQPIEYIGNKERTVTLEDLYEVPANKSQSVSHNLYSPLPRLDAFLNGSLEVLANGTIDFYIINDTEYNRWENGVDPRAYVIGREVTRFNFVFRPPFNQTYHLLLDNTSHDTDKYVNLTCILIVNIPLFDQSSAFDGLRTAFVGGVLLIPSLILTVSSINQLLHRFLEINFFPNTLETYGRKRIARWGTWAFWLLLVFGAVGILLTTFIPYFPKLQDFPELDPLIADVAFRSYLHSFLLYLQVSFLYLAWVFLGIQGSSVISYLYQKKFPPEENERKLHEETNKRIFAYLASSRMVVLYSIICVFGISTYLLSENFLFAYLIGAPCFLTFLIGIVGFLSYVKACESLGFGWKRRFELHRNEHELSAIFTIWYTILISIGSAKIILLLMPTIYNVIWSSCPLFQIATSFATQFTLLLNREIALPIEIFSSDYALYGASFVATLGLVYCYVLPTTWGMEWRRERLRQLLPPALAFFLTFVTQEVFNAIFSSSTPHESVLLTSLLIFIITYFMGKAYERIATTQEESSTTT